MIITKNLGVEHLRSLKHTGRMSDITFKYHFLIAMPSLTDDTFHQSVIFLCEHSADGAMGIIINKSLNIKLDGVLDHLSVEVSNTDTEKDTVYMGGPVGQEHGFVIHSPYRDDEQEEDLIISASKEILVDIAEGNGPDNYLVALGYAGWTAGQLEKEINQNDWLLTPYDKKIIFDTPIDQRWKKSIELIGFSINQLTTQLGHA